MKNKETDTVRPRGNFGIPFVIGIFVVSAILGIIVFKNYSQSEKEITASLAQMREEAPTLTIEKCAAKTMDWYMHCTAMTQLCDDTVARMIKVCLVNGEKHEQCAVYGDEVLGYNFGAQQCQPYMHDRKLKIFKKACADIWQSVANYCKPH